MDVSFEELIGKVEKWSTDREIEKARPSMQMLKLTEEVGELAAGIARWNPEAIQDAVGDVLVVMTILCQQLRISMRDCFEQAYEQIKERRGETVNGVFVKREDLRK